MDAVIIDEVGSDHCEAGSGTLFRFTRMVLALGKPQCDRLPNVVWH